MVLKSETFRICGLGHAPRSDDTAQLAGATAAATHTKVQRSAGPKLRDRRGNKQQPQWQYAALLFGPVEQYDAKSPELPYEEVTEHDCSPSTANRCSG